MTSQFKTYIAVILFFFYSALANEETFSKECAHHQQLWKRAIENAPEYPERQFKGQGVVVCAGNPTYLLNAWIHLNFLRKTGCQLPIELWYYGEHEISSSFKELFNSINVECLDLQKIYPNLTMGFQFKPFALIASKFQEVILLDADNFPLVDPAFLFQSLQYLEYGAIFWPDHHFIQKENPIFEVLFLIPPFLPIMAQESGQLVVDKKRCWLPLQLTLHMNEHYDFYYQMLWGDKDTFQFAWKALQQEYYFITFSPGLNISVHDSRKKSFIQRHPTGTALFYHMNELKFADIKTHYKLEQRFFLTKQPYSYYRCELTKSYSQCLFSDGSIAKGISNPDVYQLDKYHHLEVIGDQFLQQALSNPDILDWVIKNRGKQSTGKMDFKLLS